MDGNNIGFTLIEVMMALVFLAIALFATETIIINVTRYGIIARKKTQACHLCESKIEYLKTLGYDSISEDNETNIDSNGSPGGTFDRTVTAVSGPVDDTKFVTVQVSWSDSITSYSVSLQTLIYDI